MEENLWEKVAVKCLENAMEILTSKGHNASDAISDVGHLVAIALAIDGADRAWKGDVDLDRNERMLLGLKKVASK